MTTCMTIFSIFLVIGLTASQYHTLHSSNFESEEASQENIDGQQSEDADGNVQGTYSYVNAMGKITNVRYIAGNDGFKIIGEHVQPPLSSYQPLFKNSEPTYKTPRYPSVQDVQSTPRYSSVQDLQSHQSRDNYQEYQSRLTNALFIPTTTPYPAHTAGQVTSMRNYLEEEKRDIEKEKRDTRKAQSHVSVSGPNQAYSYEVQY